MAKCPKCGTKLETEASTRPVIEGPGSFFNAHVPRHFDEWSLCDARCPNPKCNFVK